MKTVNVKRDVTLKEYKLVKDSDYINLILEVDNQLRDIIHLKRIKY